MKHRKQTQHIRRYRNGKWTYVNRGIKYLKESDYEMYLATFAPRKRHIQKEIQSLKKGVEKDKKELSRTPKKEEYAPIIESLQYRIRRAEEKIKYLVNYLKKAKK